MEEDLVKLDALFDSIIDEILHPEKKGEFKNPFIETRNNRISELADAVTVIMVNISEDSMSAYATVMSRDDNHKPFTAEDILKVASENGVFYGIDEGAVKDMADRQLINTEVLIASGLAPVSGSDGRLALKFAPPDGDSENVAKVTEGVEVCHVVNPHSGRDGKDVRGRVIPGTTGRSADFMVGDGLVKKGTRYYAEYNGVLVCRGGVYSVVDEMILDKNVDQSSGIIGYGGSIVINGNVTGKAVVRAGRGVTVHGIVSGSVIEAEKDIHIDGRVTDASISANDGSITGSEFIDSTIVAGESISADVIENCTVKCIAGISCMTGYGRITGGEVYCAGDINCLNVGNREHTETHIILGEVNEFVTEIKKLEIKVAKLDDEMARITDQINIIREKEREGTSTLDDESFLDAAVRIKSQKQAEKLPVNERIKKLQKIIENAKKATLKAKTMIYGGAFLKICGFTQILNSDKAHATAYSNGVNIIVK